MYGIVRAGALGTPALEGVADRPVGTIESDSLAAVTSELTEVGLRVRRRDLVSHLRVLEAVFAKTTVVPCAFGMVLRDREAVESELLAARREELLAVLERLEGRLQLNVTARYDEQAVLREIVESEPQIARLRSRSRELGAAGHFANIRLGELVASALGARRTADAGRLLERLAAESEDVVVEASDDTTVLKASFLVARDRYERFDAALEALAAADASRIGFESIGPLPPTAFATLEGHG